MTPVTVARAVYILKDITSLAFRFKINSTVITYTANVVWARTPFHRITVIDSCSLSCLKVDGTFRSRPLGRELSGLFSVALNWADVDYPRYECCKSLCDFGSP